MITALSYIGICSDNTEDWRQFGQKILGMQLLDSGGRNMAFRMDDQAQRLIIADEPGDTISFIGWEVAEHGCLDKLASRLEDAGYAVTSRKQGSLRQTTGIRYDNLHRPCGLSGGNCVQSGES